MSATFTQNKRSLWTTFLLMLCIGTVVQAQQIYRYTNATNGAPFSVAANASGSNLTRVNGLGIPATPCPSGFSSNQWSTLGIVNLAGPAVEITVTPNPGYYLNMTSFSAGMRRNASGPPIVRFAYSVDGGASWVQQPVYQAPFNSTCGNVQVGNWDFPDFSSGTAIKFRLYGFSTGSFANGQMQVLNLNLNGAVSVTPLGAPAAVTSQPVSLTVCEGQTASFSITAGGTPVPSVQWQISTNAGASWSDIGGATALSYSFTAGLSDDNNQYRAWVSNAGGSDTSVAATLNVNPLATANAGTGGTICSNTFFTLNGSIGGGASSATWSGSGDGVFGNINNLSTTYTPGPADKLAGTVTLTLTTNDPAGPCGSAFSTVVIGIDPEATAEAGTSLTICENESASLNGLIGGSASSSTWTSSGDGVFANSSALSTSYTPGANDLLSGTVTLTLTTDDPAGVCGAASDFLVLTIQALPVVDAGLDFGICSSANAGLSGSVSGSVSSGTWSTAGDGTFNNINFLNAIYYPGLGDIANGSVLLTLTSADPAGPCGSVNDQVTVTITSPPAGPGAITGPTDVCAGTNGVAYSISPVAGATAYLWNSAPWVTINGGGTAVTMDFAPVISNSGTFIWVKASNACGVSADSSRRYIRHAIDVPQFVTPLTVVCANTSGVQYKIKPIEGYSSISWSVPAGTSIVSSTDSTVVIDFGPSFTGGNVTATATHPCMTTTRSVAVSQGITRIPGTISGPAYGVCDSTVTYSINPVNGAVSYLWTAPAGASIIGSATGLSVTVQFIPGFSSGILSVVSFNSCGLQSGARNLTVRGYPQGPSSILGPNTICANQAGVVYSVNPTPATWSYLWTVPASASIVSGQGSTSITVNFGAAGGTVNVRSQRPCGQSGVKSLGVTVNCRLEDRADAFSLFPNPASDRVFVSGLEADEQLRYEVTDVSGRVCLSGQWPAGDMLSFGTAELKDGLYIVKIQTTTGWRSSQFIVNH
ncbi:MAG: T9SS type A sorting domain-containing protein [Bacteroidia bacterium]|nr:T9SS type A sorting domain-containing protein [Bacteroidia bacterium]